MSSSPKPQVSVVVPCFNAQGYIESALRSVLDQDYFNLQLVVVDDGSTDATAEVVRSRFPSVHLIHTENRGASHARNLGTRASTGRFLQYLDADDVLAPGKLAAQVAALEETGADVAYGGWWRFGDHSSDSLSTNTVTPVLNDPEIDLFTDFWCPLGAYLFRGSVGEWNESLPVIQDARFVLDCALRGGRFVGVPGVMAGYREHSSGSLSTASKAAFIRDVLCNAEQVEAWWTEQGGVTDGRRSALTRVYGECARGGVVHDSRVFETALAHLERLNPGYIPAHPRRLKIASRLFGYRTAETIASRYRSVKDRLAV